LSTAGAVAGYVWSPAAGVLIHGLLCSHRAGPVTWGQPTNVHRLSRPNGRIYRFGPAFRDTDHDRTDTDLPNLPHRDQADRVARGAVLTRTNALFHYNARQTWSIDEAGRVRNLLVGVIFVGLLASPGHASDFGRTATPEEIKLWDIDVRRNWQPIAPSSTARFRRGPSTATTGRELNLGSRHRKLVAPERDGRRQGSLRRHRPLELGAIAGATQGAAALQCRMDIPVLHGSNFLAPPLPNTYSGENPSRPPMDRARCVPRRMAE
jgi:hypothetical protein